MLKFLSGFLLVVSLFSPVWAATNSPAAIKARLESIIPRDTIVKLAYMKDSKYSNFASFTAGGNVYVVSSADGVVRKVNTVSGNLCMINITADGERVLFFDKLSSRPYVVDWDGKNERRINTNGRLLLGYWRNPADNTHWALMDREANGTWRVNIDNPAQEVKVSRFIAGGLGGGLSDDGTRMVAYNDGWGSVNVATDQFTRGNGGCQGSMRAGPLNQWSCNESGHNRVFVNNPNGTTAFMIRMGIPDSTGEGARFTQHPDFFTYMAAWASEYCLSQNPILLRVSDGKKIGVEHGLPRDGFVGDMAAVFLPASSVSAANRAPQVRESRMPLPLRADYYCFSGRRLQHSSRVRPNATGIMIVRDAEAGSAGAVIYRAVATPR